MLARELDNKGDEAMDAPARDSVGAEHNIEFRGD